MGRRGARVCDPIFFLRTTDRRAIVRRAVGMVVLSTAALLLGCSDGNGQSRAASHAPTASSTVIIMGGGGGGANASSAGSGCPCECTAKGYLVRACSDGSFFFVTPRRFDSQEMCMASSLYQSCN